MLVREIYRTLRVCGLARSQVEFSRTWLGRSPRYYSHLIAVRREPGLSTLCAVVWRLETFLRRAGDKPDRDILHLKQALASHIEVRALTDRHLRGADNSSARHLIKEDNTSEFQGKASGSNFM